MNDMDLYLIREARRSVLSTSFMPVEIRGAISTIGISVHVCERIFGMKLIYDDTMPDGELRFSDSNGVTVGFSIANSKHRD